MADFRNGWFLDEAALGTRTVRDAPCAGGNSANRLGLAGPPITGKLTVPTLVGPSSPTQPLGSCTAPPGAALFGDNAVYFDGKTCLYFLPSGIPDGPNLSLSFWVPASAIQNLLTQVTGTTTGHGGPAPLLTPGIDKVTAQTYQNGCIFASASTGGFVTQNFFDIFSTHKVATIDAQYNSFSKFASGDLDQPKLPFNILPDWCHIMIAFGIDTNGKNFCHMVINNTLVAIGEIGPNASWSPWNFTPKSAPGQSSGNNQFFYTIGGLAYASLPIGGQTYDLGPQVQLPPMTYYFFGPMGVPQSGTVPGYGTQHINTGGNFYPYPNLPGFKDVFGDLYLGYVGCLAEFWAAPYYIDWTVEANRELFHSAEAPLTDTIATQYSTVVLGDDGSTPILALENANKLPIGSKPWIYLSGQPITQNGISYTATQAFAFNRAQSRWLSVLGKLQPCGD